MNSVCIKGSWSRVISRTTDGILKGFLTYSMYKRFGMNIISQPQLTPSLGPVLFYPENLSVRNKHTFEIETLNELISKLPNYIKFDQLFGKNIKNWLPFYWDNFNQSTYYTYVIPEIKDISLIINGFSKTKRKEVRRAISSGYYIEKNFMQPSEFYDYQKHCLNQNGKKISYPRSILENIERNDLYTNNIQIIEIKDKYRETAAALFLVYDNQCTYNLMSAFSNKHLKSGAPTLAVLEAIKFAKTRSKSFDFEGSMIKSVEKSFRQFGAEQTEYFRISKIRNRWLKIMTGFL